MKILQIHSENILPISCHELLIAYSLTSIPSFPCLFSASSSDKPTQLYSRGVNTVVGTCHTK